MAFSIPRWRALSLLALGTALLFLLFGLFASFDRVVQVRGIIAPTSGVARLVAPRAGIVTAVLVRQGERVSARDPLVQIGSPDHLPGGSGAAAAVLATYRHQQRVARAEQRAEGERRDAERKRLSREAVELESALTSLRVQVALQQQRVARKDEQLRDLAVLHARGYVSKFRYQEQEDATLELRQHLADLRQREIETGHRTEIARLRLTELAAEEKREALEGASNLLELERGAVDAQVEAEALLAAPISGRLAALRASPGMAVAVGEELASIVAEGDRLEVRLYVPPQSAGALRPGQPVALRFDAFPYQRYGVGRGVIEEVAATATSEQDGEPPTYRVRVRLLSARRLPLRPDMTLMAAVTLERRTLLDWLFAPLRERWRDAGRAG